MRFKYLVPTALAAVAVLAPMDILAQAASERSPWAAAIEAVHIHLVESGTITRDAAIVVSRTAVSTRRGDKPPVPSSPVNGDVLASLRNQLGLQTVRRKDVIQCESGSPRRCQTNGGAAVLSLAEGTLTSTAAEVFVLAEYTVSMLSRPLQSTLFRVQVARSDGNWVVGEIEVVGVS